MIKEGGMRHLETLVKSSMKMYLCFGLFITLSVIQIISGGNIPEFPIKL
jgi:hypothetical protein